MAHGHLEGSFADVVEGADGAEWGGWDLGVVVAAVALDLAGGFDAGANLSRTRACGLTAKLFIGDSRDFDVEVNAVQQGAADFGEIALEMPGVQRHSRVESPLKPHGCGL